LAPNCMVILEATSTAEFLVGWNGQARSLLAVAPDAGCRVRGEARQK
jgi:hypothetical protein